MRPLFYEEPENKALYENSTTYLWGKDILVSPVLSNEEQVQTVYFPTTASWIDFYTDSIIKGGTNANIQLTIDYIPTYIRAGAFIPMAEKMKATEDYGTATIDIHFYYTETLNNSHGRLYEDDGITPNNFDSKRYRLLKMNFQKNGNTRKIEFDIVNDSDKINSKKTYNLIIHGVKKAPKKVLFDKKKRNFTYNSKTKTLTIPLNLLNNKGELTF
jgi:alpha-glucosidase (family GH31 glycosyl hydrolase)